MQTNPRLASMKATHRPPARRATPRRATRTRDASTRAPRCVARRRGMSWLTLAHALCLLAAIALCALRFDTASTVLVCGALLCIVLARMDSMVDLDAASDDAAARERMQRLARRQAMLASLLSRSAMLDASARDAWIARCAALAQRLDEPGSRIDDALRALHDEL
jgi:hypothetical protein